MSWKDLEPLVKATFIESEAEVPGWCDGHCGGHLLTKVMRFSLVISGKQQLYKAQKSNAVQSGCLSHFLIFYIFTFVHHVLHCLLWDEYVRYSYRTEQTRNQIILESIPDLHLDISCDFAVSELSHLSVWFPRNGLDMSSRPDNTKLITFQES